jgi:hypothetical protein
MSAGSSADAKSLPSQMTAGFFVPAVIARSTCDEAIQSWLVGLLRRPLRSGFSHRKICAKEVDERYHDGYGE